MFIRETRLEGLRITLDEVLLVKLVMEDEQTSRGGQKRDRR